MGQLHEVLAVLPGCRGAAAKITEETKAVLANKHDHFKAVAKSYEPLDENAPGEPPEKSPMATTVGEKLAHLAEIVGPWWDAEYQVDVTNQSAVANVIVDGLPVLENVPSTFLMQLDKRLAELRPVYDAIPTLDPNTDWQEAPDKGQGVYKAEDEVRNRTEKKIVHKVVWEPKPEDASDRKPSIDKWTEDKIIGRTTTKRWAGMLTVSQKYEVLKKLDQLQKAVKRALSAANKAEHSTEKVASTIFNFLHEGIALKR